MEQLHDPRRQRRAVFRVVDIHAGDAVVDDEEQFTCVGMLDPFESEYVDFNGMCLQDGPAGVRFAEGHSISWQAGINNAATFNKSLLYLYIGMCKWYVIYRYYYGLRKAFFRA